MGIGDVTRLIKEGGENARGLVFARDYITGDGHIFNVFKDSDGFIQYFDGTIRATPDIGTYYKDMKLMITN